MMKKSSAQAIAEIEQVDGLIDANQVALQMRLRLNLSVTGNGLDAYAWGNAYRRCPDLAARRDALYLRRGHLQLERDAINREWPAEQRRLKAAAKREQTRRDRTTALAA